MVAGKHLFIIGHDTWAACSEDEVQATAKGLQEFGIFKLPYERVAVRMLLDDAGVMRAKPGAFAPDTHAKDMAFKDMGDGTFKPMFGPHHFIEVRNINQLGEPVEVVFVHDGGDSRFRRYEMNETPRYHEDNEVLCANMVRFLIVLLATRNITKTTKEHKLAKLGIGKKTRYEYTTTISLPAPERLEADVDHPPSGRTVCPHLRRGHSRNVPYGPGRQFRRPKWIAPMFVNADKEWVATRTAYNISGARHD